MLRELGELTSTSADDLLVVTPSWSGTSRPARRARPLRAAMPRATYWQSVPLDPAVAGWSGWIHLYLSRTGLDARELRSLLLSVALDETADVIIAPPSFAWLYHPYDGGADVVAPDEAMRDGLADRHGDWLSDHPEGL